MDYIKPDINSNNETNNDYSGIRNLRGSEEVVAFRQNSFVRVWFNNVNVGYATHWHSAIEIILPLENYYDVAVQDESFRVFPGEILMIPPRAMHEIFEPESGSRLVFLFELEDLERIKNFAGISSLLANPIYLTHTSSMHGQVYDLLNKIQEEYFSKHEYAILSIYAYLIELMTSIGYAHINKPDLFPNVSEQKQQEYIHKFNQLIEYIDSNLNSDLDLDEISEKAGFSKFHFIRLFKQYTGSTFADFVNSRRVKKSEFLIETSDLSIQEIATMSGFSSISTFNRIFKQFKGCSPSEYKQMKRVYKDKKGRS